MAPDIDTPRDSRWSDAPWWAQLIRTVGVSAALLLMLMAFVLNAWSEDRTRMVDTLQDQTQAINDMRENLLLHAQDSAYLVKSLERIHAVNMAACLNTAVNDEQQQRCIRGSR